MPRITKSHVESLKPRAARYEEWDDLLEGFYVRVYPKGAKTFGIRAQMRDGSRPRYSIGKFRVLTAGARAGAGASGGHRRGEEPCSA